MAAIVSGVGSGLSGGRVARRAAGCDSLLSEDFQAGQRFDGQLVVINPFL